jgi:hypothetical protein
MPKQKRHSKPPSGENLRFFGPSELNLAWMREVTFLFCYTRTYGMICSVIAGHQPIQCPSITERCEAWCHGLTGHSYETRI